jgi:predicted nucleic acid-binding protein
MALTHVVDTSVLTRLRHRAIRAALEPLAAGGQIARAGISDLEVGFSARNLGEWTHLSDALEAFSLIETDVTHMRRARQVQRLLAARGLRGRKVPDLLIAAAAEGNGLAILHYDADFDLISRVTGQPSEWVVERSTESARASSNAWSSVRLSAGGSRRARPGARG